MDPSERKISVWICQEEKLVSGLSRRTTCSDVVRVLLEDGCRRRRRQRRCRRRGAAGDSPGPGELPEPTDEDEERGFFANAELSHPKARVVLSRERPCLARGAPARPSLAMTQEKQRRVVRKAFRKLAKLNRRRQQQPSSPCSSTSSSTASSCSSSPRAHESASMERMETLVHLVLSQDHTIRQQVQRLRELDREIDRYEAKVHLDRMRRHGVNYVQDTYLVGAGIELDEPSPGEESEAAATGKEAAVAVPLDGETQVAALEELARRCDDLMQLQEQRAQQEELLERLSAEIQEELNQRWMQRRQEELAAREEPPGPDCGPDGELLLEQERVRTQLSTSLYIGLRLNTDLEAVKSDLDYSQQQWVSKERELQGLLQTLHTLELTMAPDGSPGSGGPSRDPGPQACAEVWVDQARGLSKSCPGNDDDSDTGLSSMHSQDSDSVPVCESLV
nr:ras association domain-containing protein 10 [Loxodonta africana]